MKTPVKKKLIKVNGNASDYTKSVSKSPLKRSIDRESLREKLESTFTRGNTTAVKKRKKLSKIIE